MRSRPSAIDALDTLYEPNAVFSQFLGPASTCMVFFFLSFPCFLFFSIFFSLFVSLFEFFSFLLFLSFLFFVFPVGLVSLSCICFSFPFLASYSCLFFLFLYFPFFFRFLCFLFFLCFSLTDLSLTCVCVVIGTTCKTYQVRGSLFWVASGIVVFFRREYS